MSGATNMAPICVAEAAPVRLNVAAAVLMVAVTASLTNRHIAVQLERLIRKFAPDASQRSVRVIGVASVVFVGVVLVLLLLLS
jgi:phosphotransferase system  glucose/maltose/N-acetylglucosamine-specific IIC component